MEIKLSALRGEQQNFRVDSEFNLKEHLQAIEVVRRSGAEQFGSSLPEIIHPTEIDRVFEEEGGVWFFRAQNLRPLSINDSDRVFVSDAIAEKLWRSALKRNDLLVTRTGANAGDCALYDVNVPAIASSHTFIVRSERWSHSYLAAFFNCRYGRAQILKARYGAAQPEVAPTYLKNIWIPHRTDEFFSTLDAAFVAVASLRSEASRRIKEAEERLLFALDLDAWVPPEALSYVRSSTDSFAAGRLDAQFFAPKVEQLLARLGRDGLRIADVAPARHERFEPTEAGDFDYIEIGSLGADGTATSESIPMGEAPSRATQYVRAGDVVTSTVRPIRRLSALIAPEQDGAVCSSGFVVLQPKDIPSEVLLTYLRLPLVCELMDLHTSATMYPAISEADLLALPIPVIAAEEQAQVQDAVRQSARARQRATHILDAAKRAVEIAIEDSEPAALAYLQTQTEHSQGDDPPPAGVKT